MEEATPRTRESPARLYADTVHVTPIKASAASQLEEVAADGGVRTRDAGAERRAKPRLVVRHLPVAEVPAVPLESYA
ncbi:MAG TPA: hypothetical protein VFY81_14555, partial [Gammaproteobacteria bacterium]|nr:hypothetical protein [Gammaproteobacteria bacterium]